MAEISQVINNATTKVEFAAVDDRNAIPTTLLELTGANTASSGAGIQTVDISTFGDGLAVPKLKVATDESFNVSGIVTKTPAFEAFRSLATGADATKECYMVVTNGDGSTEAFYAMVSDYSTERAQRDVLKFTSTVNVQSAVTLTAAA